MPDPVPPPAPGADAAPPPAPSTWQERLELLAGGAAPSPARLVAGGAAALVVAVVGWSALRPPPTPPELSLPVAGSDPATTTTTAPAEVLAHAAGAVRAPGVYRLPAGSRVADLIDAAGGPADGADLDRLNLAAPVTDGSRVYVPVEGEPTPPAGDVGATGAGGASSGPIDLNTATADELDTLPGIGPATATAIIDERTRRGRFRTVDELLEVRGIGPAKLDAIRDLVTV